MDPSTQFSLEDLAESSQNKLGLFPGASVLGILRLILAGSPLSEVLAIIARLVESQGKDMFCTIWLPDEKGIQLHCVVHPVFLDSVLMLGPCWSGPRGHPAALPFIGGSRCM